MHEVRAGYVAAASGQWRRDPRQSLANAAVPNGGSPGGGPVACEKTVQA